VPELLGCTCFFPELPGCSLIEIDGLIVERRRAVSVGARRCPVHPRDVSDDPVPVARPSWWRRALLRLAGYPWGSFE
jgi:hypothetical protein